MDPRFQRLALITGPDTFNVLTQQSVIIFGVGGVGSWCAEALVRSGIRALTIVDSDSVCVTNINRQVQATSATIGQPKVAALKDRLAEINPACRIDAAESVFSHETADRFNLGEFDYVIDAIDSVSSKLDLIEKATSIGTTFYSCMGMAQKLDPTCIKTVDIWETSGCSLARLVRSGLKKRGFTGHFTTVYSNEKLPRHEEIDVACGSGHCLCPANKTGVDWCATKKVINGSAVPVTASAGMILASLILRDLMSKTI